MNPQSKYILFFSNNCIHSREFINQLYKNQPLFKKFIKVDVQNAKVNIPKCVNAVPAIIIKTPRMKPQVYIGDEVFTWYNHFQSRLERATPSSSSSIGSGSGGNGRTQGSALGNGTHSSVAGILDYDPCTMSGFSDNFAYIDDKSINTNPIEHKFEFLNNPMGVGSDVGSSQDTPIGGGMSEGIPGGRLEQNLNQTQSLKSENKSELDKAFEQLQAQRSMEVPQTPQRKGGGAM